MNNEFFAKACQEWRERLLRGDFTPEMQQKAKWDSDKDKQRLDPWKVSQHFCNKTGLGKVVMNLEIKACMGRKENLCNSGYE